jgi:hypothetical protein
MLLFSAFAFRNGKLRASRALLELRLAPQR